MAQIYFDRRSQNIKDKFLSFDFLLVFLILALGIISIFAMYSSEQGKFGYYTQNHLYRFLVFFSVFIFVSFLSTSFWYKSSYIFYFLVLLLLIFVHYNGITASGSKRWINLFFINLQPSELMKVGLIVFLSRYYYKIPTDNVTNIKYILTPVFVLFIPIILIIAQPDLGTAVLIMIGGISVIWLSGFKIKYFLYSFVISI